MIQAELILIAVIAIWGASIWAGDVIAKDRDRHTTRYVIASFLFGPFAVLVMLALQPDTDVLEERKVKAGLKKWWLYCGESVQVRAIKCGHCGSELTNG
ncbi:MAG: hypothetical protein OXJ55_10320 [Caldilineaceae bacterium]|nr:hypothetical protein [Caldilineaceae bacterium]